MKKVPRTKTLLSDIGLFYAAAIWGATFFIVKMSLTDIDPVIMVGYRFLLAGGVIGIGLLVARKPLLTEWRAGLILGALLWILYASQTIGLKFTSAANSGFITGLFVVFVPLFLLMFWRRRPTITNSAAVIVSLIGLWILSGGLEQLNRGDLLTIVSAIFYAAHLLYSDHCAKKGLDPYLLCFQQFLFVGVLSLVVGVIFHLPFTIGSVRVVWLILFLTFFPTITGFIAQLLAQRYASPMKVSLIFALEPVFAALFAWTLGGEQFDFSRLIGGLLICAAIAISAIPLPVVIELWKKRHAPELSNNNGQ